MYRRQNGDYAIETRRKERRRERESEREHGRQCEWKKKKEETPVAHFTDDALFAYINLLARNGNCNGRISSIDLTKTETDMGDTGTQTHEYIVMAGKADSLTHATEQRDMGTYAHTQKKSNIQLIEKESE